MWMISRFRKIRMDSRIFAITFIMEGFVYVIINFYSVDIEIRGFFTRLMIIILCLSQLMPLTVAYMRSLNRDS